ncbi:hypothetical protein XENORESO_002572 [Xenotaenia resolanae]|uniref:Secreted protein n=1 Tax=Xenotaenia resolanae TaxID=208358 RepID=A0ABV0W141_9TELE
MYLLCTCLAPSKTAAAGDGACSDLKMFNILIIQLLSKGGETQRESKRERRDMFRPRPNNKRLHTESVTPLHSQRITHFRLMLQPAACITHSAVSSQGRHFHWKDCSLETSDSLLW